MEGMSERQYAAHVGLSRGAIQKAKDTGRLVQHADGSIDAIASDARRAAMTDPAKQRGSKAAAAPATPKLKPVPDTALSAVGETLRDEGLPAPVSGGGTTFVQASLPKHPALRAPAGTPATARGLARSIPPSAFAAGCAAPAL